MPRIVSAAPDATTITDVRVGANATVVTSYVQRWPFYWLCGLVLSFAYERPLAYLTPFDRTNPRLFDVMVLLGVLTLIVPNMRLYKRLPGPIRIWAMLVLWFCVCAMIWALFLPWEYGKFSLFTAAKYVEGLLALYMASLVPLNARRKRAVLGMMVLGGVFVALYCIPEYLRSSSVVLVRPGLEVTVGAGVLVGPFGASYFQLAQTSALLVACTLAYFTVSESALGKAIGPLIAGFAAWPILFAGSRTGLGLLLITCVMLFLLERRLRRTVLVLAFVLPTLGALINTNAVLRSIESGATMQRLRGMEGGNNSLEERLGIVFEFPLSQYKAGPLLPVIGGGFYVAPRIGPNAEEIFRVDYGVHSMYLFPFEQAGLIGLTLFLGFIVAATRRLLTYRESQDGIDAAFANAMLAYFIASLVVGIGGHNFWQGFSSGNFNTALLLMLLVALVPCTDGDGCPGRAELHAAKLGQRCPQRAE